MISFSLPGQFTLCQIGGGTLSIQGH